MGRGDLEKILQAYLEDILWHSEDVAGTKDSYQCKTELINQYYKASDKHKMKHVHLRALYENILANIDVCRNLKQEVETTKIKSEELELTLKTCQESREYYKAKCKTILAIKYTPNFNGIGPSEDILEVQNKQIEDLSKKCQQTREDLAELRRTSETIKFESRRMRRKFTSLRQKYATAVRHSGRGKKLKRYSNTLTLNENYEEDWAEQNTQTDDEEPIRFEEENKELKEAYRNLRDEHEELALKTEKLEDQLKSLNEKLGSEARERENLQREVEDCEEELSIWEKRCKDLSETCSKLKEEQIPKQTEVGEIQTQNEEMTKTQPAIVNQAKELYYLLDNCHDRLVPTSKLKKEMIRIHGKNLQELVALNKKMSKTQRNDDDSKHQQQEFKRNLNRVKGDIKTLEEDNDKERLTQVNEVKRKFEEDLSRVLQTTRETLQNILEDTSRSDLLSRKYEELMSIMREENRRLENVAYDETDHVKKNEEQPASESESNSHEESKGEESKKEVNQFDQINAQVGLLVETLGAFDGTETDEVRGDLKQQFLACIARINAIKVDGDEVVRSKKIEAIKHISKCIQELDKGRSP